MTSKLYQYTFTVNPDYGLTIQCSDRCAVVAGITQAGQFAAPSLNVSGAAPRGLAQLPLVGLAYFDLLPQNEVLVVRFGATVCAVVIITDSPYSPTFTVSSIEVGGGTIDGGAGDGGVGAGGLDTGLG